MNYNRKGLHLTYRTNFHRYHPSFEFRGESSLPPGEMRICANLMTRVLAEDSTRSAVLYNRR